MRALQLSSLPLQTSNFTVLATMSANAASMSDWLVAKRACAVPPETAIALSSVWLSPAGSPMPSTYVLTGFVALMSVSDCTSSCGAGVLQMPAAWQMPRVTQDRRPCTAARPRTAHRRCRYSANSGPVQARRCSCC